MAKEKNLLLLVVVVVIVGVAAGFLYWKNTQKEAASVPEYNALPPPGWDHAHRESGPGDSLPEEPQPPDVSDFPFGL